MMSKVAALHTVNGRRRGNQNSFLGWWVVFPWIRSSAENPSKNSLLTGPIFELVYIKNTWIYIYFWTTYIKYLQIKPSSPIIQLSDSNLVSSKAYIAWVCEQPKRVRSTFVLALHIESHNRWTSCSSSNGLLFSVGILLSQYAPHRCFQHCEIHDEQMPRCWWYQDWRTLQVLFDAVRSKARWQSSFHSP